MLLYPLSYKSVPDQGCGQGGTRTHVPPIRSRSISPLRHLLNIVRNSGNERKVPFLFFQNEVSLCYDTLTILDQFKK